MNPHLKWNQIRPLSDSDSFRKLVSFGRRLFVCIFCFSTSYSVSAIRIKGCVLRSLALHLLLQAHGLDFMFREHVHLPWRLSVQISWPRIPAGLAHCWIRSYDRVWSREILGIEIRTVHAHHMRRPKVNPAINFADYQICYKDPKVKSGQRVAWPLHSLDLWPIDTEQNEPHHLHYLHDNFFRLFLRRRRRSRIATYVSTVLHCIALQYIFNDGPLTWCCCDFETTKRAWIEGIRMGNRGGT